MGIRKTARRVKSLVGAAVLLVLFAVSALFTYGPRFSEKIPSWQDIYEKAGLTEQTDRSDIYDKPFTVSFLDVGQGSSTLLRCEEADFTMLVDTGEQGNDTVITDAMRTVGAKKLDYVVLTHPHSDHVGSFPELVKTVGVDHVLVPEIDRSKLTNDLNLYDLIEGSIRVSGAEKTVCTPGMKRTLAEATSNTKAITLEVLGPCGGTALQSDNLNNSSLIIRITYGSVSVLLTGDAEYEEELRTLDWLNSEEGRAAGVSLQSQIMAAGHHGSYTSSNRRFIAVVQPKYVVVSCGKDNDFGHPHDSTLRTFRDTGAKIFRTDELGTVVIGTDGTKIFD